MSVARRKAVSGGEAGSARGDLMKAIVQDRFGPPDTLQLVDTEKPEIGSGDVLLKVHAAAVNPYDWHMLRGDPRIARLMGRRRPDQTEGQDRRCRCRGPGPGRRRRRPGPTAR